MTLSQGFPKELLEKPINERISYFEWYMVNHPIIGNVFKEVWETIHNKGSYSILYIFGPTGVGKTTLYKRIIKKLFEKEKLNMANNQGVIPFLGTRAIAPESGSFDWKDFYIRSLEELREPLINQKKLIMPGDEIKYGAYHNDKSTKAYRKSLENALKYRKTSVFLIDEAQHFAKIASGKKLLNQMDVIKSLAAETETFIVLFGTYGLQNFLNLSDQLSRRGKELHFPRYRYDNKEEFQMFENVLWSFQCHLPLKKEIDLVSNVDFFYERSLGCIGILKDWLDRTFRQSLINNNEQLTIDDFYKSALTISQCSTIADEIINGERQQEENEEQRISLLNKLGMNTSTTQLEQDPKEKTKKKNKRVGERSPKRDKVGGDKYA